MDEIDEDAEWDAEYEKKRRLLCEIFGRDPDEPEPPERPINTTPLFPLSQIWPDFPSKLKDLLTRKGEHHLASTVDTLWVYDRCRCGADHCATAYTQPKPKRGFGPTHRNVAWWSGDTVNLDTGLTIAQEHPDAVLAEHLTILDVVTGADGQEQIMEIEVLHDAELRDRLVAALPDEE